MLELWLVYPTYVSARLKSPSSMGIDIQSHLRASSRVMTVALSAITSAKNDIHNS